MRGEEGGRGAIDTAERVERVLALVRSEGADGPRATAFQVERPPPGLGGGLSFIAGADDRASTGLDPPAWSALPACVGDPAEGGEGGHEHVFAAAEAVERGHAVDALADGAVGDGEPTRFLVESDDGVAFGTEVDEVAAVDPLLLEELDRVVGAGADEDEEQAALVVLVVGGGEVGVPFGAERRGAADDPVDVLVREDRQLAAARVHAAHVRRVGAHEAAAVVGVVEVVVAGLIHAEVDVVLLGGEDERRPRPPPADELGAQGVAGLLRVLLRVLAEEVVPGADTAVVLAEHDERAVTTQHVRRGHGDGRTRLAVLPEDELARRDGPLLPREGVDAGARDERLAERVVVAERVGRIRRPERVRAEQGDPVDLLQVPQSLLHGVRPGLLRVGVDRHRDVQGVVLVELLPRLRGVLARVHELARAGRHALPERQRETREGLLRQAHRLEAGVADCHPRPRVHVRGPVLRRGDVLDEPAQQGTTPLGGVDPQPRVDPDVGLGPRPQDEGLDVVELQRDALPTEPLAQLPEVIERHQ